jgi:DNA-binding NarL/FixJ family response regulator
MNGFKAMEIITARFPSVKAVALSMSNEEKYILEMINLGASGYLLKNAGKTEIIQAVKTVAQGGTYFSADVSDSILEKVRTNSKFKDEITKPFFEERVREIMYLMCMEKTTKEIAVILNLSSRTIEDYRSEILTRTNSRNIVGVIKHAIQIGLVEDELLRARFEGKV